MNYLFLITLSLLQVPPVFLSMHVKGQHSMPSHGTNLSMGVPLISRAKWPPIALEEVSHRKHISGAEMGCFVAVINKETFLFFILIIQLLQSLCFSSTITLFYLINVFHFFRLHLFIFVGLGIFLNFLIDYFILAK